MTSPDPDPDPSKFSFPAVVDGRTRVLILGSLPGEASLARGQYYAHRQNQFWRLMADVTDVARLPALAYPERLTALLGAGVGLWDVIRSAKRVGSLDAAIREHEPNALGELAASLPSLRAVAFNGGKAAHVGARLLGPELGPELGIALITLPSSSPAHTMAFERKRAAWLRLRDFLGPAA